MILFLLHILANTSVIPYPTEPPTWGNLVPWVVGFLGLLVSSMLYFIINQQSKQLNEMKQTVEKLANAVFLSHRARLVQMATDPNIHPTLKEQCDIMVREIDQETQHK